PYTHTADSRVRPKSAVPERQRPLHLRSELRRMRDDDERRVELAIELEHEIENLPCVGTIEISGRLVGQYDGRLRDERACDGGPLTLSARKLARSVLDPLAQPHPLEQLVRTRARFLDG